MIKDMSYEEFVEFVNKNELSYQQVSDAKDKLASILWNIGILYDKINGVESRQFSVGGTVNHRSMTYKLRKIAGYSYP